MTGLFYVQLIFVSRPEDLCRDIKHLFILKSILTLTLLVATRHVHPLSTLCRDLVLLSFPKLLLQHLLCLNKIFHVAKVSVATYSGSVTTDILRSVQHYVQHKLSCSQLTCICFSHFVSRPAVFCRDLAQLSTIKLWCCHTRNVVATRFLW